MVWPYIHWLHMPLTFYSYRHLWHHYSQYLIYVMIMVLSIICSIPKICRSMHLNMVSSYWLYAMWTSSGSQLSNTCVSCLLQARVGSLPDHFLHRPSPFLPDWFHGLTDHLTFILLNGLFCLHGVRLSRLLVGFRTHFKSLHFHFISFHYRVCK